MKLGLRPVSFVSLATLMGGILFGLAGEGCTVTVTDGPLDGGSIFDRDSSTSPPGATDACSRCLYAQCAPIHSACETSRDCIGVYNCAVQPGASVNACIAAHPNGRTGYTALATCDQRNACTTCAVECAASPIKTSCEKYPQPQPQPPPDAGPQPTPDAGPPQDASTPIDAAPAPVTCESCTSTKCPSQKAACVEGSECRSYSQCVTNCVTGAPNKLDACVDACSSVYPNGRTQGEALSTCTTANCRAECF